MFVFARNQLRLSTSRSSPTPPALRRSVVRLVLRLWTGFLMKMVVPSVVTCWTDLDSFRFGLFFHLGKTGSLRWEAIR